MCIAGNRLNILADISGCPNGTLQFTVYPYNKTRNHSDLSWKDAFTPLQIPGDCDGAYCAFEIITVLDQCKEGSIASFGGVFTSIGSANASFTACDQMIAFKPNASLWSPSPQIRDVDGGSHSCSGQSGNKHATGAPGASASLEFNGTAVAVAGTIENAQYNIVSYRIILCYFYFISSVLPKTLDGSTTTLPQDPFFAIASGSSETLFFISGLDPTLTHTLNISNIQNATTAGILNLDSIQIFGNFSISS
jgi:hypothetical protein